MPGLQKQIPLAYMGLEHIGPGSLEISNSLTDVGGGIQQPVLWFQVHNTTKAVNGATTSVRQVLMGP